MGLQSDPINLTHAGRMWMFRERMNRACPQFSTFYWYRQPHKVEGHGWDQACMCAVLFLLLTMQQDSRAEEVVSAVHCPHANALLLTGQVLKNVKKYFKQQLRESFYYRIKAILIK